MAKARRFVSEGKTRWTAALLALAAVGCMHDFGAFSTGDGGAPPPRDAGEDATPPSDAAGMDTATDGVDSATGNDSSRPDTSIDAPGDAPPGPDSSTDAPAEAGPDPGIFCGTAGTCSPTTQVCCQESPVPMCLPQPGTACTGFTMPCDDAADCAAAGMPGDQCCALVRSNGSVTSVTCTPAGQCRNSGPNIAFVLCDPLLPGSCAAPRTCGPNGTGAASLNVYYTCN